MGCGLGGGSLVPLSSSIGMTWGLLCFLTLRDGVVILCLLGCTIGSGVTSSIVIDWGGLLITLGGGTFLLIACNCSLPSSAKGALVLGPVSAAERSFAACVAASAALMC
eukprot:4621087-Ditylum_brightwellii.AAC.1